MASNAEILYEAFLYNLKSALTKPGSWAEISRIYPAADRLKFNDLVNQLTNQGWIEQKKIQLVDFGKQDIDPFEYWHGLMLAAYQPASDTVLINRKTWDTLPAQQVRILTEAFGYLLDKGLSAGNSGLKVEQLISILS